MEGRHLQHPLEKGFDPLDFWVTLQRLEKQVKKYSLHNKKKQSCYYSLCRETGLSAITMAISSKSWKEYLQNVWQVFLRLGEHNLTAKLVKWDASTWDT